VKVRAWNVSNLSGEGETHFIVANDLKFALESVMVFPNPVVNEARFRFNHNRMGQTLRVSVRIVDMQGRVVDILKQEFVAGSTISEDILWNGSRADGKFLSNGLYNFQVEVTVPETGESVSAWERMVLMR
jgi:flagellar hook assembly protein FlgD